MKINYDPEVDALYIEFRHVFESIKQTLLKLSQIFPNLEHKAGSTSI